MGNWITRGNCAYENEYSREIKQWREDRWLNCEKVKIEGKINDTEVVKLVSFDYRPGRHEIIVLYCKFYDRNSTSTSIFSMLPIAIFSRNTRCDKIYCKFSQPQNARWNKNNYISNSTFFKPIPMVFITIVSIILLKKRSFQSKIFFKLYQNCKIR